MMPNKKVRRWLSQHAAPNAVYSALAGCQLRAAAFAVSAFGRVSEKRWVEPNKVPNLID